MRGKPIAAMIALAVYRITPADAGKTLRSLETQTQPKDHPRGCGENTSSTSNSSGISGSPPRMRGKPSRGRNIYARNGITPADAGKTESQNPITPAQKDHPRGCGENTCRGHRRRKTKGSPPRMRGKLQEVRLRLSRTGITPADAGKTTDCR